MTDGAESCAVGLTGCDGQICLEIRTRSAMVCFGSLRIGVAFSEAKVCAAHEQNAGILRYAQNDSAVTPIGERLSEAC